MRPIAEFAMKACLGYSGFGLKEGREVMRMLEQAAHNLETLKGNRYPGRGVLAGLHTDGKHMVQATWLMGRSENSRNRVYKNNGGRVYTDLAKPDPKANTALTIYEAMAEHRPYHYIASNGEQTFGILRELQRGGSFSGALGPYSYEPDAPHHTPRISSLIALSPRPMVMMSVIRKLEHVDADVDSLHNHFNYSGSQLPRGIGYCLTTYAGDGNPLPSYTGNPYPLPLSGKIEGLSAGLWDVLNRDNRVALAVKFIPLDGSFAKVHLVNMHQGH